MSDLLNQASLVYIPSGYKEDTAYSVIPTDGSGDLTFTRASDGTRVNSSGLVENVPWNLVKSSGDISTQSTYWASNQSGSTTQNAAVAPDGTTTAAQITSAGSTFSGVSQSSISVSAVPYTYSCYLKATSGTPTIRLTFYDGVTFHQGNFTITSEWVRYSFTFTPVAGTFAIYNTCSAVATWLAWGAQLNSGSTAKPYFPTTDRQNVPRLTYEGGCPSLLLEPQRTNLVTYSEQMDDSSWNKNSCTISANASTSPDGYVGADKFIPNNAASGAFVQKANFGASGSTAYSYSVFLKAAGFTSVEVGLVGRSPAYNGGAFAQVNLTTGAITSTYLDGTWTSATSKIDALNDGWYRVSVSGVSPSGTTGLTPAVISSTTGNGTDGFLIWGAQAEQGSYATSYIPTTSASVTRVADAAYKTGISSLIGQTEGTIFVEMDFNPYSENRDIIYVGTSAQAYRLVATIGSAIVAGARVSSVSISYVSSSALTAGKLKIGFGYKSGDHVLYINGTQIGTSANTSVPTGTISEVNMQAIINGTLAQGVNQTLLFKTRLTNAELAALTTL